ncbi:MAG: diadenylate cyclase CdaA [Clostridia bacterium]|nr:diadenylate cyclase CdaA [Clostridia bacterium]
MGAILDGLYTLWNQIIYALSNMRVFDIVDILAIAWIIYKAIGFLLETRAGLLVKGLTVIFGTYLLARLFELTVVSWLLSVVVDSALVVMAIIFQPEIRRMLEKVGHTKLLGSKKYDDENETVRACIDNVTKAAGSMQQAKVGALIVFERETQLADIVNTGTVIDAECSVSMVNNVFFPNSPLHDGAMIIRDGRIYAAGCILPLTQRPDISSHLGTRHRAAIGISENSDAIVLVVSEETGTISIVNNGEMQRDYNSVSAYAELSKLLVSDDMDKKDNALISALKGFSLFGRSDKSKDEEEEVAENEDKS